MPEQPPDCEQPCGRPEHFIRHLRETLARAFADQPDPDRGGMTGEPTGILAGLTPAPAPDAPAADILGDLQRALARAQAASLHEPREIRMNEDTRDYLRDRLLARGRSVPDPTATTTRICGLDVTLDPLLPVGVLRIVPHIPDVPDPLLWLPPVEVRLVGNPRASVKIEPA